MMQSADWLLGFAAGIALGYFLRVVLEMIFERLNGGS